MEIPRLTADNMCHKGFNRGARSCLSGHLIKLSGDRQALGMGLYTKLLTYINANTQRRYEQICRYNDNHTFEQCAEMWNGCFHGDT